MSPLVAIAHIIGSVIVVVAYGAGVFFVASWVDEKTKRSRLAEASIALRIPIDALDDAEHTDKVMEYTSTHYSSDLLKNRVADLCGWVDTAWTWVGVALQVGAIAGTIWFTATERLDYAINAWWIVPIAVACSAGSIALSLICNLVTGRYPGGPRRARKMLTKMVEQQWKMKQRSEGGQVRVA